MIRKGSKAFIAGYSKALARVYDASLYIIYAPSIQRPSCVAVKEFVSRTVFRWVDRAPNIYPGAVLGAIVRLASQVPIE